MHLIHLAHDYIIEIFNDYLEKMNAGLNFITCSVIIATVLSGEIFGYQWKLLEKYWFGIVVIHYLINFISGNVR